MGDSQWQQIKKSFETAFLKHPKLVKYYICLPLDRQEPRRDDQESFMDKWNKKTQEWIQYAKDQGREISFEYWGSSELITRLSREQNAGRIYYWFGQEEFSDSWFKSRVENNIADLGPRYTRELNFELDIAYCFDGLSRNEAFRNIAKSRFNELIRSLNDVLSVLSRPELSAERQNISEQSNKLHDYYNQTQNLDLKPIDQSEALLCCKTISESLSRCERTIEAITKEKRNDSIDYIKHKLYKTWGPLRELEEYFDGPAISLANGNPVLLTGEAGIGKSHLLADVASKRLQLNESCLFVLGQHFTSDEAPWTQIIRNLLRLNCNERELLGALNTKAQAQGSRILFIVDAINEGRGRYFWPDHIRSFIKSFKDYEWLGLVLSIRSSYQPLIIPEDIAHDNNVTVVEHEGFGNVEYKATNYFFLYYGIELPSIPLLHPEFKNPLFLKLFCEGIRKAGLSRIPKGHSGITGISDFFLDKIDAKLSKPSQFEYPEGLNIARRVINKLVEYKISNAIDFIPYEVAYMIADRELNQFSQKKRYLDALISEGVLSKNLFWVENDKHEEGVYLAYERFEDHITASFLLDKYLDKTNPEAAFQNGGQLESYIDKHYYRQGILEAFSIRLPELINKELYELLPADKKDYRTVAEGFINSLIWRKNETITEKLLDYINKKILPYEQTFDSFFEMIYSVAADPNHLFNANRLHRYQMQFTLAERDAIWTTYLHNKNSEGNAIRRMIDWAWSEHDKSYLSDESRLLAGKALAWLFTSTDLVLRDHTTKALVSLFEEHIELLKRLLEDFQNVNDPYVYERLFAAAYGSVLRSDKPEGLKDLAEYVIQTIFMKDEVYPNVLLRDYARNIVEYALCKQQFVLQDPSIIRPPYRSSFPDTLPTNEDIVKYEYDYQSKDFKDYYWGQNDIIHSMVTEYGRGIAQYGDFGRYTFQSKLSDWDKFDPQALSNYACKLIFEKYGYDVEKHGAFDRNATSGDRSKNKKERIGKKYQWIALYEVMARISDNHKKKDDSSGWGEKKKYIWYEGPWEPFARNIDPTLIFRKSHIDNKGLAVNRWWIPIDYADWDSEAATWIISSDNLPDATKLIDVKDDTGLEWLVLEGHPNWDEPVPLGTEKYQHPHKNLWYQIRSYLLRDDDAEEIISWTEKQHFMGDWHPRDRELYQVFSREYFWSPAYRFFDNPYYGAEEWSQIYDKKNDALIGETMPTAETYRWETGAEYEEYPSYLSVRQRIFDGMRLNHSKNSGEWVNQNGEIICFDPSVKYGGPSYLLIKKADFKKFIENNKFNVFWTCLGEKHVYGDMQQPAGRLELSGTFRLQDEEIVGTIRTVVN